MDCFSLEAGFIHFANQDKDFPNRIRTLVRPFCKVKIALAIVPVGIGALLFQVLFKQ
jgi:hypothetical protein